MSDTRITDLARRFLLSSLNSLGTAGYTPIPAGSVPANKILGSLAAAGALMLATQPAEASVVVTTPNVNVGFAAGDIANYDLLIGSDANNTLVLKAHTSAGFHSLLFQQGFAALWAATDVNTFYPFATPAGAGANYSTLGTTRNHPLAYVASRNSASAGTPGIFTDQYYAFVFLDSASQTHYGWVYGSLSDGGYNTLTYNLISYAYDTTPNEQITTGQTITPSSTPEPSTFALGAMAALVLGAAGARKWKKDRQAAAATTV